MKQNKLLLIFGISLTLFVFAFGKPTKVDAAIAFRAASTASAPGATSISIAMPTGTVQGDVMVASIFANGNQAAVLGVTPPAGWTQVQKVDNTTGSYYPTVTLFTKPAGAGEAGPYVFTFSNYLTAAYGGGWIATYTGVNTTTPVDVSGSQNVGNSGATTTTYSTPSITTTGANEMLVFAYAGNCATNGFGTPSSPAGVSVIASNIVGGCTRGSGYYVAQAAAGSSGSITSTAVTASYGGAAILALKPLSPASATTTGNAGYSYNYFYSAGTVTNNTGSTAWYGTAWGAGAGYSGTACSALPNKTDYSTIGTGTNNQSISAYVTASASTTYYFCVYVKDSGNNYYYSPTTSSLTTSGLPAPAFAYTQSSSIDDTSAIVGAGMASYVSSPTVTARWGTSNVACSSLPNTAAVTVPTGNDVNNYISHSKRITGLSPSTTYYWCIQGTTTQGTGYSAVSSFATSAALGSGCDLLPSSGLASAGDKTTIAGYLGTSKMQGTLLYKATTNGWASGTFHTAANTQGETITLVKNSGNNKVFGAYNPQSWSSAGSYTNGSNAFLFSLSDGYQLKQFQSVYQAYNAAAYGPTFGGGHDIGFPNTTLNVATYTNVHSYETPSSKGAPSTYINGTNTNSYTPSDIEVYKISVCTASAPSVSTPTSANIGGSSATLGGNVTSGGTQAITARGVCYAPTATDADPRIGDSGVTCTPEGGTTTGVFTMNVSNLTANTGYSYNAYATNSVGTGYSIGTFSTLNVAPTTVSTSTVGTTASYYAQLNGQANPNGYPTFGHFRLYTANPSNCTADSGGTRFPAGTVNFPDIDLGSGTSLVPFTYTIPMNSGSFLVPSTTYYYCAYAVNTVNSTNYTTGASGVVAFTTPDGPASPCDPPSTGNLTIPSGAACNFNGMYNGVDSGTGTRNTATMTIAGGVQLSISAGQRIAFGSLALGRGAILTLARGASLVGGGIFVHDKDRDNYLDDTTQYIGSTASASTEFIRRNLISSAFNYSWKIASSGATYDCNNNSAYAYRMLPNLARDADNDGYKTAAAAGPSCVGAAGVFNGRTYYNDGSGPN